MIHTPPVTFSYTIIHRNSRKRQIDLSILSLADNSINLTIHQEVRDAAGTLLDTNTAILTFKSPSTPNGLFSTYPNRIADPLQTRVFLPIDLILRQALI